MLKPFVIYLFEEIKGNTILTGGVKCEDVIGGDFINKIRVELTPDAGGVLKIRIPNIYNDDKSGIHRSFFRVEQGEYNGKKVWLVSNGGYGIDENGKRFRFWLRGFSDGSPSEVSYKLTTERDSSDWTEIETELGKALQV